MLSAALSATDSEGDCGGAASADPEDDCAGAPATAPADFAGSGAGTPVLTVFGSAGAALGSVFAVTLGAVGCRCPVLGLGFIRCEPSGPGGVFRRFFSARFSTMNRIELARQMPAAAARTKKIRFRFS